MYILLIELDLNLVVVNEYMNKSIFSLENILKKFWIVCSLKFGLESYKILLLVWKYDV